MKQTFKTGILGALFLASMQAVQAQPNVAAPTPDEDAADVVSLFSEHYTTTGNGPQPQNWGHGATLTTITGTEDAIIAVNGTCDAIFTTGWSAQNKGTIHVDIWPATDGVFSFGLGSGFDNNATWIDDYEWPTLTANQWNTVEVPVVEFVKAKFNDDSNVQTIKFKGSGQYWVDNIYAYGPKEEYVITAEIPIAPAPTYPEEGVRSAFSDSYASYLKNGVVGVSYAGTSLCAVRPYDSDQEQEVLDLGTIKSVTGDGGSGVNISTLVLNDYDSIHVDVYYASDTATVPVDFEFGLIENSDLGWKGKAFHWLTEEDFTWPQLPPNEWVGINVPVAPFLEVPEIAAANGGVIMIRFRGIGHFYVDNLYVFMNEIPVTGLATPTVQLQQTLADNVLTLHTTEAMQSVALYSMTGQQVLANTATGNTIQVDVTALPTGSYVAVATLANGQKVNTKVVK